MQAAKSKGTYAAGGTIGGDGNDDDIDYDDIDFDAYANDVNELDGDAQQNEQLYDAMHAMFGVSQHVVTKEGDTATTHARNRFIPLDLPSSINVNETRAEYQVEEQQSHIQLLASITSMLLHVRHGHPMQEFFHKSTQTLYVFHCFLYHYVKRLTNSRGFLFLHNSDVDDNPHLHA